MPSAPFSFDSYLFPACLGADLLSIKEIKVYNNPPTAPDALACWTYHDGDKRGWYLSGQHIMARGGPRLGWAVVERSFPAGSFDPSLLLWSWSSTETRQTLETPCDCVPMALMALGCPSARGKPCVHRSWP